MKFSSCNLSFLYLNQYLIDGETICICGSGGKDLGVERDR